MDLSDDERQRQSSAFCRLIELYPDPSSLPVGALACARATARLLVSLTRDRAWLTREPFESRCRREVVHQLAACGRSGVTFSALAERLPAAVAAEAADVERALAPPEGWNPPTGDQSEGSARRVVRAARRRLVLRRRRLRRLFHRYSREHDAAPPRRRGWGGPGTETKSRRGET